MAGRVLERADDLVTSSASQPFDSVAGDYREALAACRGLADDADRADASARDGAYLCGVAQYRAGKYITVLCTGPVAEGFPLKACGSCTSYSLTSTLRPGFKPCDDSGKLSPGYVYTECAYTSGYGY
ncbi:hypothetical protein ACIQOU_12600 [Streptomyces sp. NPDC091279]|uniref:hypothetical protein n=1 Tax=unclassified Streptomyces TaxID=2593676 RepID=UPI0037F477DD